MNDRLEEVSEPTKGKIIGYVVAWLLGNGCLFSWNSVLTAGDYLSSVFPDYHPTRVLTLVYQPFALGTLAILTYYEARINTRKRVLWGYSLFCFFVLLIPILDLATSGAGGIGVYIGICVFMAGFGLADALVQGGMMGDLSYMHPDFIQAFSAGLATSGVLISGLRLITKASFVSTRDGLRKGALVFFFISAFSEFLCVVLYAFVFPKLEIVKYYRSKTASQGSQTVIGDLAAAGITNNESVKDVEASPAFTRRTNMQLLMENRDYVVVVVGTYVLTLSIFPGFLAEDTGEHSLGTWYALVLIALVNGGDLVGRLTPHVKGLMGPEQNALGNILVTFLLAGIFAGVVLDWLWLIGKGW